MKSYKPGGISMWITCRYILFLTCFFPRILLLFFLSLFGQPSHLAVLLASFSLFYSSFFFFFCRANLCCYFSPLILVEVVHVSQKLQTRKCTGHTRKEFTGEFIVQRKRYQSIFKISLVTFNIKIFFFFSSMYFIVFFSCWLCIHNSFEFFD